MCGLFMEKNTQMSRHISTKNYSDDWLSCVKHPLTGECFWLVIYFNEHACLHHDHLNSDDHQLCGPMVFCCQAAYEKFCEQFSDHDCVRGVAEGHPNNLLQARETPADQIISWMDAGIQFIYFIVCDSEAKEGISVASLSGNEARQALLLEISLGPYLSVANKTFGKTFDG